MLIILKFIGIVLLVLFLLALAILLTVLCTPLRYRVQGGYHDEKPDVEAKLSIWFSALAAYVNYTEEGLSVYLRIFGRRRYLMQPAPKEKQTGLPGKATAPFKNTEALEEAAASDNRSSGIAGKNSGSKAETVSPDEMAAGEQKQDQEQEEYDVSPEGQSEEEIVSDIAAEPEIMKDEEQHSGEAETEKTEFSASERLNRMTGKLKGIYNKVQLLIEKLQMLYRSLERKEQAVVWFLDEPSTKHVLAAAKSQIVKILKSILPRKLTGELQLGLEDPALMGKVCMLGGMFYPMYQKHFTFTPVFGEKVIEGEGFLKGRIILGAILAHIVRMLLMRDLYRCLKNVKILMRKLK